ALDAEAADEAGLVTFTPDDIDWEDEVRLAVEERAGFSPDGLIGMEANPRFLDWWKDMGPDGTSAFDVYLRTAISTDTNGWANFGYVKMPDYRWGIFLADGDPNRVI